MDKGFVYIGLTRDARGNLVATDVPDELFKDYTNEQLKEISTIVDGCEVVKCPVLKRDENGNVIEFGIPAPN